MTMQLKAWETIEAGAWNSHPRGASHQKLQRGGIALAAVVLGEQGSKHGHVRRRALKQREARAQLVRIDRTEDLLPP